MASTHQEPFGQAFELHTVNADPQAGAGLAAPVGSVAYSETYGWFQKTGAGNTAWAKLLPHAIIADPGDGNAIPVTQSGSCMLTSAGAETRTLAIPTYEGQRVQLCCTVYAGNIVVTVASAFHESGATTITFPDDGAACELVGVDIGGTLAWRIVANNGCTFRDSLAIADPGNAGAIPVTGSGVCALTSAGAETRTMAIPAYVGQRIVLECTVYVGDIVVTVASAHHQSGATTITFPAAGATCELLSVDVGGAMAWRVVGNNGCAYRESLGIADPGNAGAISVVQSGTCALTSAGAETRTMAIPTFEGQRVSIYCTVHVGNIVTTVASAIDQAGNTTITMDAAGDFIELQAVTIGGALAWRVVGNNGCALT